MEIQTQKISEENESAKISNFRTLKSKFTSCKNQLRMLASPRLHNCYPILHFARWSSNFALCEIVPQLDAVVFRRPYLSSFQLQIVHRLNRWILDFLIFEIVYRMQKMDFGKCSKSAKEDCSCVPCFPLLHCSFLAYFERLRQRIMRLQSLVSS